MNCNETLAKTLAQLRVNWEAGNMYGSNGVSDDAERTAFRRAEKKYKVYYDDSKSSKKYLTILFLFLFDCCWFLFCYSVLENFRKKQLKQVDLSEVVDFKAILRSFNQSGEVPPGTFALQCDFDRPVFCIENRPGMWISRGNGFLFF